MNKQAEQHLGRAEGFLARGDEFYGKAADEIIAAQKADSTLTNAEIAERFGHTKRWASDLVQWRTSGSTCPTPYSGNVSRASSDRSAAKKVLREAPLEEVETIVDQLPPERQAAIAQAVLAKEEVATEVMADTSTRHRADAAAERARNANRGQVRSERAAAKHHTATQAEIDQSGITRLGIVSVAITDAWQGFARAWAEVFPTLSGDAQEAAYGVVNLVTARAAAIESGIRGGDDLDAVLDEILNQGA